MMGLPGKILGIPGYLVSRDPLDSMPGGTTRDCPGYPGILSTMGLTARLGIPGILPIQDPGLSWVYQDT